MNRKDFTAAMTRIAIARQCKPLTEPELEVYFDELGIYSDEEIRDAIQHVVSQPYRTFPTVGDFVQAIAPEYRPLPRYNVMGRHEDYLPRKWTAGEYHAQRKREAFDWPLLGDDKKRIN